MGTPRLFVVLFVALGVVVAAIAALALQSWAVLLVVLLVHALGTGVVIVHTLRRASQTGDKPDPVTEARIEEEQAAQGHGGPRRTADERQVFG